MRMGQNDAEIHLKLTGEQTVERGLDRVADSADRAGQSVEGLGESSTEAGKATKEAGGKFKATADEAELLAEQITKARDAQRELIKEFARTGDVGTDKEIRKSGRELSKLQRYAKALTPDDEADDAGQSVGRSLLKGVASAIKGAPEIATPALIGLGVLAAPALGATISAAVLGGVGTGGIIGGVALASRDPRVKAAGAELGHQLLGEFSTLGAPFIDPLIDAAHDLGNAGAGWATKLGPSMERLAGHVKPLVEDIEGLVDRALPGFSRALDASGPVLDAFGKELPEIGAAVGGLLEDLASNPEAAIHAIEQLGEGLSDTIEFTGGLVSGLMDVYETAYQVADALSLIDRDTEMKRWVKGADDATEANGRLAASTEEAAAATWDYKSAIDALYGRVKDTKQANIDYEQSVDDLAEGLRDGKRTLDITTQAGRDNWEVITANADAIKGLRDANLAANMPLEQANRLYEQQFDRLRDTLLGLGYNKQAVNDYINSLRNIPKAVSTTFSMPGIESAASAAERLERSLRNARGIAPTSAWGGGFTARAGGGPYEEGLPYLVGEHGPELLVPRNSGTVMTAAQTRQMLSGQSGGSAMGGTLQFEVTHRWAGPGGPEGDIGEALAKWIRSDVKVRGGGSVVNAYDENT